MNEVEGSSDSSSTAVDVDESAFIEFRSARVRTRPPSTPERTTKDTPPTQHLLDDEMYNREGWIMLQDVSFACTPGGSLKVKLKYNAQTTVKPQTAMQCDASRKTVGESTQKKEHVPVQATITEIVGDTIRPVPNYQPGQWTAFDMSWGPSAEDRVMK
ncbi:hypothetical protein PV04_07283 [Phialophora macrospora]|uniref:Uncharacterized protein n=1 Tax=Phialophora macrospora TaxID=1851006 RepID=A0A0D2FDV1_9EURO|nr:hypothetical protein PV04_07283 [Phialophora macrospora]